MLPKVSVIIPCYNIEQHLPKCIESILIQSFDDFELILINDGSTDDTKVVCESHAKQDSRIKVFHQENAGVSAARNLGLQHATGDLLIFIDGDDYIKNDYIEQLVNNYVKGNWPICGMINVRNENPICNKDFQNLLDIYPERMISKSNFMDLLKYYSFSSPCARIYSAKIIKDHELKFDPKITYQEDLLFNLEYVQFIEKVTLLDYFGYYYIEHMTSSSGRFHQNFNHVDLLFQKLNNFVRSKDDTNTLKEFILQTTLRKIANVFHTKSLRSKEDKLRELNKLFGSTYFKYTSDYLDKLKINIILKRILKLKNSLLLYFYFQFLHSTK